MLRRAFAVALLCSAVGSPIVAPMLVAGAWAPSIARAQGASVSGTLEQVNTADGTIVIRTGEGPRSGRITPQTLVVAGGMPGDLRDLRPGQRIVVQFALSQRGSTRTDVVRIEIRG